jgi:hypothetical protein
LHYKPDQNLSTDGKRVPTRPDQNRAVKHSIKAKQRKKQQLNKNNKQQTQKQNHRRTRVALQT